MKDIRSYSTRLDADLARIALEAAEIPAVVVGTGVESEGGVSGVQLLVPDHLIAAATTALKALEGARTEKRSCR